MSIKADLQHYMETHPDKNVFLKDLEKEFNLTKQQIQSGMYQLVHLDNTHIDVIQNGQIWKFISAESVTKEDGDTVITILQETPKGSIIFQMNESIWIARKVED